MRQERRAEKTRGDYGRTTPAAPQNVCCGISQIAPSTASGSPSSRSTRPALPHVLDLDEERPSQSHHVIHRGSCVQPHCDLRDRASCSTSSVQGASLGRARLPMADGVDALWLQHQIRRNAAAPCTALARGRLLVGTS